MQASAGLKNIRRPAQAYARLMQAGPVYAGRPKLLPAGPGLWIYAGFKDMQAGWAA